MQIIIQESSERLAKTAARNGEELIRRAIHEKGHANIILATGASQLEILGELVKAPLNWPHVTVFHLDEYVGIPVDHPASFRKYLKERFADLVPVKAFHYIDGEADPAEECTRVGALIRNHPIDVAFIGIGENGHLAFNDPPADLEIEDPYIQVKLDLVCRTQQYKEGWFPSVDEVPMHAISMSVHQIMKSGAIICTVPDERKAEAVKNALENGVSPEFPASVLKTHKQAYLYLDKGSSSMLKRI